MKRNWKDVKWIFEPVGSLIDIYGQEVSHNDWRKVISLINERYNVKYDGTNLIDKKYSIEYLTDETREMESKSASIHFGSIQLNCHFFLEVQIEFDIDPKEINSIKDFEIIESFMIDISAELDNHVTLTVENNIKFPLIKIDMNRGINRYLTKEEMNEYRDSPNSFISKMQLLKTKLEMKLTPRKFQERLLKSASEPYQSTNKDENVW